jgi:hypothetical protein
MGVRCLALAQPFYSRHSWAQRSTDVEGNHAQTLRRAIESLINAKLHDAIMPGGLDRLAAHRRTGVASYDIRMAERKLEQAVNEILSGAEVLTTEDA